MDRTVAIFGGSFDPPTIGHVMVASHIILNEPTIDSVMILPCFQQEHKQLSAFEDRFSMCQLAFNWLPDVIFSEVEKILGGESLTARTIKYLSEHTSNKYRFVMGSDLLDKVHTWEGWSTVEELAPPIIVGRAGIPSIKSENTPICPVVSSSMVRNYLRNGNLEQAKRYLSVDVYKYIVERELYL